MAALILREMGIDGARADVLVKDLRSYVRVHYWVDRERLNEIHRFQSEEFGLNVANVLNVYPESIPEWVSRACRAAS